MQIPVSLLELKELITSLPIVVQVCLGILAVLTLYFFVRFLIPAAILHVRLKIIVWKLRRTKGTTKAELSKVFGRRGIFSHLWQEFSETLHEQKELNAVTGLHETIALRSTVPAEAFFNSHSLVDSRLSTEFFKHLPGIFTGIGIIGTFTGLILGLADFQVSESPITVRHSLDELLKGVREAFYVSAGAITLAMVITLLEKLLLAGLYRKVEKLAQRLDSLYEAGAGEEYLSRLVKASEDSSAQTKTLKDALVTDLRQILTELTDKQIAASIANNGVLADQIKQGLTDPITTIANAVTQVGQDQGVAVNNLLTDVLAGFSQRLEDLLGSQINGITQQQQQTIQALQATAARMEQMAANIEQASQRTTNSMADKMAEAIGGIEARQRVMAEGLGSFIDQMRQLLEQSRSETTTGVNALLSDLGDKIGGMVTALQSQSESAAKDHASHIQQVSSQTEATVATIASEMQTLLSAVTDSTRACQDAINSMKAATSDAITRLNSGADTLYIAASDFAKAGAGVTAAMTSASGVATSLSEAATSVGAATRSLDSTVSDYRSTREAVSLAIQQLKETVDSCKREASLTENILSRIEGATDGLVKAHAEAEDYMKSISDVLGEGFEQFSENLTKIVGESNTEFYQQLSRATKLLKAGIEELESTISAIPAR